MQCTTLVRIYSLMPELPLSSTLMDVDELVVEFVCCFLVLLITCLLVPEQSSADTYGKID